MKEIILEVKKREDTGTKRVNRLRRKSIIPAVVYGEGKESINIQVVEKDFSRATLGRRGESFVMKLLIKDGAGSQEKFVLIKELQHHPVSDKIIHIDFNEVSLTKTIKVKVPTLTKGEESVLKQEGGMLEHVLWELEVECLPAQIPETIEIDVSAMKIGDSIHVKDLTLPQGVKVLNEPDAIVISLVLHKEEVAAPVEEAAAEVKAEPEVIKEKKEKEPEAAETKGAKAEAKGAKEEKK